MKLKHIYPTLLIAVFMVPWLLFAANDEFVRQEQMSLRKTMGQPNATLLNINEIAHWIRSNGISAHDPNTNGSGVYFPRGVGAGVIFTDGLVWGGYVNDGQTLAKRVGGTTYPTGLQAGKIISKGTAEDPGAPDVRIWRVRVDFATADLARDAAELQTTSTGNVTEADIADVRAQYRKDWMEWPADKGAPFDDRDGNGIYEPDPNGNGVLGELEVNEAGDTTYVEDIPGYPGADQTVWFVANDLNPGLTASLYGSPPIGIEMQATLWGYDRTDALGNVVFKRYRFIYKGTGSTGSGSTIDSMFVAQWSDPDLGEYSDDFVGTDVDKSLSFVWNSTTVDPLFDQAGFPPPAAGYDFLQGPVVEGKAGQDRNNNGVDDAADFAIFKGEEIGPGYINLPMTAFNFFAAGSAITDPDLQQYSGTDQWYNLMNGMLPRSDPNNPEPFTNHAGEPTKFTLDGDPVTGEGDTDENGGLGPGDRRMQMISGPFSMALGDTNEVVTALITGMGADRLSSISVLRYNDIAAQSAYDNFFELPKAPPAPVVQPTPLDQKIILDWGSNPAGIQSIEGQDEKGYTFQGYNVYQLPSASATSDQAERIATYDVVDEVTTILDKRFDVQSGQILDVPVQLGTNSGIKRREVITKDAFTGRPLVNGTRYYFAVTAYNFNPGEDVPTRSLESSMNVMEIVPQSNDPGVVLKDELGDSLEVTHTGNSDGTVTATVINPKATTGNSYKVFFTENPSAASGFDWGLLNTDTGDTLLSGMLDQSDAQKNPFVEGVEVKVLGPPAGMNPNKYGDFYSTNYGPDYESFDKQYLQGWDFEGTRWISGTDIGGMGLFGGLLNGYEFFGTTLSAPDYVDVEMRFTDNPTRSEANGWQKAYVYRRDLGWPYPFYDIGWVPFTIWNTEADPEVQLNVCFVEAASMAPPNNIWDMGWDGSSFADFGGREYIFIMRSEYSPDAGTYDDTNWGPAADVQYAIWPSARGSHPYQEAPFNLQIFASNVNTATDEFAYSTQGSEYSEDLAKTDVEKINVFPNPYYGYNPQETDLLERFVTFNHLPQKATIRIFDLAGTLVRTLEKDDESQFLQWDLANHNELPVASGIYIAHIEMPDLGENKILKLAIIREQEYLLRY